LLQRTSTRRRRAGQGQRDVALSATIYAFEVTVNDTDRGVYETLEFRVARHPSETEEFLLTRVLAYCLEYGEGLAFSSGLSDPDAPALSVRDLTGALRSWIEIGAPEPARLHRATKAAQRVVVYSHKNVAPLLARLDAEPIHRGDRVEIYEIDRELLAALVACLERRMRLDIAVTDRHLYISVGERTLSGAVTAHRAARAA
jgi:uncharacterized protein YaeQ